MYDIPLVYIKDKQFFTKKDGMLRLLGKPLDVAKKLKEGGCKLIHIVDSGAISGSSTNLDVYDGLTFFINVQVECAPNIEIIRKLLSLKCRVVLEPSDLDLSALKERKLLVAKIPKGYPGDADGFHDVILADADDLSVSKFSGLGKRVMIYSKDKVNVKKKVWGVISTS